MTVSVAPRKASYMGNGVTNTFAITFQFFEIEAYINGVFTAAYTITGGNGLTGSVVFNVAPANGAAIVIISKTVPKQEADYVDNDSFPADSHEKAMDRLAMVAQDVSDRLNNAGITTLEQAPVPPVDFDSNPGTIPAINASSTGWDYLTVGAANTAAAIMPTGFSGPFWGKTAPTGWVLASGRTIGSVASGATERANADTLPLYTLLWNDFTNAELPIEDSSGSLTTRGATAAADFAAHKRLPVPDGRDRLIVGRADMGGSDAGRIADLDTAKMGAAGGSEKMILPQSALPNVAPTITINDPGHTHPDSLGLAAQGNSGATREVPFNSTNSGRTGLSATTGITATASSINGNVAQTAINKMPPYIVGSFIIKL